MTRTVLLSAVATGTAVGAFLFCPLTGAAPTGFVQRDAFDTALDDLDATRQVVDFDSFSTDTVLPSGTTVDGIRFSYDLSGEQLEVRAVQDSGTFDTTSTPFFLATTDAGVLQDGDNLLIQFENAVTAFGLFVASSDVLENDDIVLTSAGFSAGLERTAVITTLGDGARVYFLGIVDAMQRFDSVTLTTNGGGFFLYALDDLEIAVAPDADGDGVVNAVDNCVQVQNPTQTDSDGDNIGNACDADIGIPNDCQVNIVDLGFFRAAFFGTPISANWNPDADFNSDGVVNVQDLGILRNLFFGTPGPSGLPNACQP